VLSTVQGLRTIITLKIVVHSYRNNIARLPGPKARVMVKGALHITRVIKVIGDRGQGRMVMKDFILGLIDQGASAIA
jgi:hypothetical protein